MQIYTSRSQKNSDTSKSEVNFHVVKPKFRTNAHYISNSTLSVTPYFRNYVHSRRNLGSFLKYNVGAVFSDLSASGAYRDQFFTYWALRAARTVEFVRVHAEPRPAPLLKFSADALRRHYMHSTIFGGLLRPTSGSTPVSRLWLTAKSRIRSDYLALGAITLRRFLLPVWLSSLQACTRMRTKLAAQSSLFFSSHLPAFAFRVALGSGSIARLRSTRYVYADWIKLAKPQTKRYNRKRIMGRRYVRLLFGMKRIRFFLSLCDRLKKVTNRLARFRHLFYFRLVTFIASTFRIGSPTRVLVLIKTGHVFINGRCVRNPSFQLSALDVISFSRVAQSWVSRLRRAVRPMTRRKVPTPQNRRVWKPRIFRRAAHRSVILGPNAMFAVVRCVKSMPHPLTVRGVERRPYMASGRIRFLLGTLQY